MGVEQLPCGAQLLRMEVELMLGAKVSSDSQSAWSLYITLDLVLWPSLMLLYSPGP